MASGFDCILGSMFKIPILVHIIMIPINILNTWYFKSDTLLASINSTNSTASVTTTLIDLNNTNDADPWYYIYKKHYLVTLGKLLIFSLDVTFLIYFYDCPWTSSPQHQYLEKN